MIGFHGYMIIESQEDWEEQLEKKEIQLCSNKRFYCGGGYGYEFPTYYPIVYEYCSPFDSHLCGSWRIANKQVAVQKMRIEIEKQQARLNRISSMVDTLALENT